MPGYYTVGNYFKSYILEGLVSKKLFWYIVADILFENKKHKLEMYSS